MFRNIDIAVVDTSEDNICTGFSIVSLSGPRLCCSASSTFKTLIMRLPVTLLGWLMSLRMHNFESILLLKKISGIDTTIRGTEQTFCLSMHL
jgi:hypothetical protein